MPGTTAARKKKIKKDLSTFKKTVEDKGACHGQRAPHRMACALWPQLASPHALHVASCAAARVHDAGFVSKQPKQHAWNSKTEALAAVRAPAIIKAFKQDPKKELKKLRADIKLGGGKLKKSEGTRHFDINVLKCIIKDKKGSIGAGLQDMQERVLELYSKSNS